jgi:histidinol dehydrogenase
VGLLLSQKGVSCRRVARAIGAVGLYVPGGTAVLPSTALMLAVVKLISFNTIRK